MQDTLINMFRSAMYLILVISVCGCAVVYKKADAIDAISATSNQPSLKTIKIIPLIKSVKVGANGCLSVQVEQNDKFDELVTSSLQSINLKAEIIKLDAPKLDLKCDEDIASHTQASAKKNSYLIYQYQEYRRGNSDNFAGLGLALGKAIWAFTNVLTIGIIPFYDSDQTTYKVQKLGDANQSESQDANVSIWVWGPLIFSKNSTVETPPFFSRPLRKANSEALIKLLKKSL